MSVILFHKYPPPWKAEFDQTYAGSPGVWTVTTDTGDPRDDYDVFEDPSEDEARLIAASPELYAQLKFALECLTGGDSTMWLHPESPYHSIYAALRKAEGKS